MAIMSNGGTLFSLSRLSYDKASGDISPAGDSGFVRVVSCFNRPRRRKKPVSVTSSKINKATYFLSTFYNIILSDSITIAFLRSIFFIAF